MDQNAIAALSHHSPTVSGPGSGSPITSASNAVANAIELYAMSLFVYEAAQSQRLTVGMLSPGLDIHSTSGGPSYQVKRAWTQRQLSTGLQNLIVVAAGHAAIVADAALDQALGPRNPSDRSEVGDFRGLMYMIRCAVAHDPMIPHWECRGPYRRAFSIPSLALTVDMGALDGTPFQVEHVGGWKTFLQETDLVGPRHLRSGRGPVRFFDFHTVDVGGGGAATEQRPDKSAESFCGYLVECAWPKLGLPRIWQVDNESALAGFPAAGRIFTQPVRLALLLGVEVRFIPMGEPGRNADVESFNALWQERVLHRFETPGLARLARMSDRFERWFMDERPHPKLSLAAHGTRFPGALLASLDGQLRKMPTGFSLDAYRDAHGELRLPLARGRISWVRRVAEDGELPILDHRLRLRRAANEYVICTLSVARAELTVQLDGRIIGSYRHSIAEKVVRPLVGRGRWSTDGNDVLAVEGSSLMGTMSWRVPASRPVVIRHGPHASRTLPGASLIRMINLAAVHDEPEPIIGNRAIEDAAVTLVKQYERRAGRDPRDTRYQGAAADLESSGRIIEVKAAARSVRQSGFLFLEARQVEEARTNPDFYVYVVENVGQGDPAAFELRILDGARLQRLIDRAKERRYFEVPLPRREYDALIRESATSSDRDNPPSPIES